MCRHAVVEIHESNTIFWAQCKKCKCYGTSAASRSVAMQEWERKRWMPVTMIDGTSMDIVITDLEVV